MQQVNKCTASTQQVHRKIGAALLLFGFGFGFTAKVIFCILKNIRRIEELPQPGGGGEGAGLILCNGD
jgi:hypothetical protein